MPVATDIARALDAALQAANNGYQNMAATDSVFPSGKPAAEAQRGVVQVV